MSKLTIDLDYNCSEYIKNKISLLEVIYQELLRQEVKIVEQVLLELHEAEPEEQIPQIETKKISDKILCECGMEIIKRNMKRHCSSKTHIFNMEMLKRKENSDLQI